MTKENLRQVLSTYKPSQFVGLFEGDAIEVDGVKFAYLWTNEMYLIGKKIYVSDFQSVEPNSNGEYKMIKIKVIEKRVRGGVKYVFDTSSIGCSIY